MQLALFDLDHTLIPLDSDHAWGVFTTSLGWNDPDEFTHRNDAFYADYRDGTLDIAAYVRFSTAALCRVGPQQAGEVIERFLDEVIRPALLPAALALLAWHRAEGAEIVLVTATNDFVTRPIASALGIQELLATRLERSPTTGWFTGEIDGTPCFQAGKVERVSQWLASRGWGWDSVETTFYSDSINDLPLLEHVAHPVATNADARLSAVAAERGWPTLQLFV
ncbi:HAD family hydrolase [Candidatus Symbiobacter mobilis]|uniref:Phosphoserine phosphatase n=1 Tax=Candidatus Symbiobacter mobilis CR TaxID=946483 RepID=U5N746_9BURK|nr:HAD family hydrolase [Candidatus Symbiobacter mobilis]AGX87125.1 phosphoserine phosphatase [Candidatus Symbiobacter mobilis CR]